MAPLSSCGLALALGQKKKQKETAQKDSEIATEGCVNVGVTSQMQSRVKRAALRVAITNIRALLTSTIEILKPNLSPSALASLATDS
jgi:hypothetical protein